MTKRPTAVRGGVLLAVVALAAAACGGSSSGGNPGTGGTNNALAGSIQGVVGGFGGGKVPLNAGGTKGGTLNIGTTSDVDYMDPARTYYAFSWDFHQLFNRTLLTYPADSDPTKGLQVVGDIATGPATGEKGNTVWTYHLKQGIKYEDGSPVTSKDVKYAIERTFATDVINGGPTYFATFLDDPKHPYPGPYKDKDPNHLGLKSIVTPDDSTITFNLTAPFSEWNFLMTTFGTSPVPQSVDQNKKTGGANYNNHVVATGPYKVTSYVAGKKIQLERNTNYDPATDGTRAAYPDKINFVTNYSADTLDGNIAQGTVDLDLGGTGVQTTEQTKILSDPTLKSRALNPVTGFTRYISIFTKVPPLNNIHCRKAIEYAVNKQNQVRARGGSIGGGAPASTMDPPSLLGYEKYDLYPSTNFEGDVTKAKAELKLCGKPNGFSTTIVTSNSTPKGPLQAQFLQQDLKKIGVKAAIKQFDAATYYSSVVGVPKNVHKNKYGLAMAGWGPDWPAPYGFYENIVDPRKILPAGNSNYSECDNPAITTAIDQALKSGSQAAIQYWNKVDRTVLGDACNIPVVYDKALVLFSARLHNVYIEPAFGIMDIRSVAVQ